MKNFDTIAAAIKAAIKTATFLLLVFSLIPVALIFRRMDPQDPFRIPRFFHRILLWLLGISLRVYGEPSSASPVLFVSNHMSYLDVPVLGSLLSAGFVAKAEVADWPLFGILSRIQNSVFIERRTSRAVEHRSQLQDYLAKGQNLILFPEGTSSDGLTALPFKSSLFGLAEESMGDKTLTVQPVSITCVDMDGFPMLREERSEYAWFGDMVMVPHLWGVFQHSSFAVEVMFHAPLTTSDYQSRKDLAAACQEIVAEGIKQSLARRGSAA